jgi:mono/diheme cytochrome c family protein
MTSARSAAAVAFGIAGSIVVGCHSTGSSTSSPTTSAAPAPAVAAKPAPPPGVTAEMIASGDSIFNNRSCKNCHGIGGVGGARAPSLTDSQWIHIDGSYDAIVKLVTSGFTKAEQVDKQYQFTMNPRGGVNLTDAQIAAVAAYVWSLSRK